VRFGRFAAGMLTWCVLWSFFVLAQDAPERAGTPATAMVPRLIRVTGSVRDAAGKPITGKVGLTFTLYKESSDLVGVWQELQTAQLDGAGRYNVLLGAGTEEGLPQEIFSSETARWLGVRPDGQAEQPRILFLSVAYALKAADTDMLGGHPASAFVLADTGQKISAAGREEASRLVDPAKPALASHCCFPRRPADRLPATGLPR
jgi:hypothetical protein